MDVEDLGKQVEELKNYKNLVNKLHQEGVIQQDGTPVKQKRVESSSKMQH